MEQMKNTNTQEQRSDDMGVPIHSQVKKIKQEYEKIQKEPLPPQQEIRPVFKEFTRQLSRSPLGRMGQAISVGDS